MSALRVIAALALLSAAGDAALLCASARAEAPASAFSFERLIMPDGEEPPVEVGVWTPASGSMEEPRPLIVISHGNGGDFRSHRDTAEALASSGFIVASLTHTGDNWRDQSRATDVANRPRQFATLIDYMLNGWKGRSTIDPQRIGAFGFSAGGFTVLSAAGGKPALEKVADHCRAHPTFYDCKLLAAHPLDPSAARELAAWPARRDIKAMVIAAPALGFAFTRDGLASVTQPVQLWQASDDEVLPAPWYVEPVRKALPRKPEFHLVDPAGHFDFLAPCTPAIAASAPEICRPTPGLDRTAFHLIFNREVVRFFRDELSASISAPPKSPQ